MVIGRWLGESVALGGALVVGLGVGGVVVAFGSGADGLPPFVVFVCTDDAWIRFLGGMTAAAGVAIVALTVWMLAPLAVGVRLMSARDL